MSGAPPAPPGAGKGESAAVQVAELLARGVAERRRWSLPLHLVRMTDGREADDPGARGERRGPYVLLQHSEVTAARWPGRARPHETVAELDLADLEALAEYDAEELERYAGEVLIW